MISFHFETLRPVSWTSVATCFVLLATLCCCNCVPHHKTVNVVDPLRSASESSTMADTGKQQHTAAVDLGALLDAGEGAVVILVAGDTRLAVHRRVLAAGSPVLAAMFRTDLLEASNSEIDIPGVEGPVLRQLVVFLYTGRAPQLPGMTTQLLAAAEKYGVSALKDSFEQQAAKQLSVENAVATAVLAQRYSCHSLSQAAIAFIRGHLEVMATEGWAEAVLNHPGEVVQISRLLVEPPAGSRATTTTDSTATPTATVADANRALTAAPTTADSGPAASAAPTALAAAPASLPTAGRHSRPPDATAISHLSATAAAGSTPTPTITTTVTHAHEDVKSTSTPATPVASAGSHYTQPPDAAAISLLRALSGEEKGRRLRQAATEGSVQEVRALLAAGADTESRSSQWQQTALHFAAANGHTGVVRLLLEASADLSARNKYGATPLHAAAYTGQAEVAAVLLNAGANRAARDVDGETALDYARQRSHLHLLQMLQ